MWNGAGGMGGIVGLGVMLCQRVIIHIENNHLSRLSIRSIYLMKYPLGRFSPHGKGGRSVYQRAAQEAKESYNAGGIGIIDALVALLIIGAVGLGIYAMFTGGGEAVGVLFSFALFTYFLCFNGK